MAEDLSRYIVNPGPKTPVTGLKVAVTSDSAIVTETMMKVLKNGGKAVDAGIAGAMVQAAVEPFMTNHAGLVTFLYYEAKTGKLYQLESQGNHPSGLPPFRPIPPGYAPYSGAVAPSALIPGFMPGLKAIHAKFGTRPWAELCEDAVAWAERGHMVSTFERDVTASGEQFTTHFPEGREFYMPNGFFPAVGDVFVPKGMAATLKGVRDEGPDYMINGPWAHKFVRRANAMGWNITLDHMTEVPPRWLEPIRFKHHEYEIVTLGPPQIQGFMTGVTLGILRHLGIRNMKPGSAEHLWAMGHALRQGVRHYEFAQDETIYDVPREEVLDDNYLAHMAKLIRRSRPKVDLTEHIRLSGDLPSATGQSLNGAAPPSGKPRGVHPHVEQHAGSCELAIVDAEGNWVQMMDTLQGSGIPGMVVGGIPMVGSHAQFGRLSSGMDSTLVKGAKLRCVIGNTIVLKDGKPVFSAGTPGLPHFTVPQVLTYALDFKMDPYAAVDAPRMCPMTEDRGIVIEDRMPKGTVEDLHKLGIRVGVMSEYDYHMGSYSVIARDEKTGTLTAVADPRRCAVADGIKA